MKRLTMLGLAALFFLAATARADEGPISVPELDKALARRVRQFLGPALAAHLEITVHDGQTTLGGTVPSPELRRVIEQKAEEIAGENLIDQIKVNHLK